MAIFINPGSGPETTEDNARANMSAFWTDLTARKLDPAAFTRNSAADYGEGRYAFDFCIGDELHQVQMPGWPLEKVRYLGGEQSPWDFPRLYVDDSSWLWFFALNILMPDDAGNPTPDGTVQGGPPARWKVHKLDSTLADECGYPSESADVTGLVCELRPGRRGDHMAMIPTYWSSDDA